MYYKIKLSQIKETVPDEFYQFLMKLDSPKEIVKALRLYLDTGTKLLKYLAYADFYDRHHKTAA